MADIAALQAEIEHLRFLLDEMTTPAETFGMHLTKRQRRIFASLQRHPGMTMPHSALIAAAYLGEDEPEHPDAYVKNAIWQIRLKMDRAEADAEILTVPGIGYRYVDGRGSGISWGALKRPSGHNTVRVA